MGCPLCNGVCSEINMDVTITMLTCVRQHGVVTSEFYFRLLLRRTVRQEMSKVETTLTNRFPFPSTLPV